MVNIIEKKAEQFIRHALKIYQFNLTLRSKTMSDDWLQSGDWTIMQLMLYADRAQVREQFTENAAKSIWLQTRPYNVLPFV